MNREQKQQWIDALRSGEYKQGTECLQSYNTDGEPRYCCIGVASELFGFTSPIYSKLSYPLWQFLHTDFQHKLIEFNDKKGWSFEQIADWIEKEIPANG